MWIEHALWWHVYPLGACGAPIRERPEGLDVVHRLTAPLDWLDHLVALGCNGLQLGPVFASETHGYDTTDHYRIDPRLGAETDLTRLIEACHARGLRVLLDGVFNHVGRSHPAYRAAVEYGPDHAGHPEARILAARWPDGWAPGREPEADVFEGHGALVELDHSRPETVEYVVDVMLHWLRRGIDGWRLDAAYAVPAEFWRQVLPRVRAEFPEAWFVGEVIHGDYAAYVAESTLDSVTQYELWKAIWSSIRDRNFHELEWSLRRHAEFLETFAPMTFVGNHDTTRIASQVPEQHVPLAVAVLCTVGGVPSFYYGDERGLPGVKEERIGGDDAVRPAFPRTPAEWRPEGLWLQDVHRGLIAVRRDHPWLHRARPETVEVTGERLVYDAVGPEGSAGGQRLRVELDLGGEGAGGEGAGAPVRVVVRDVSRDDAQELYSWASH